MQNFTLGKKGHTMLLFALVLLIGSFSSYAQCPSVAGTSDTQQFCFLATVGQIQRDGTNTAVYQTADNANDTQAIPSTELLSNNTTYYVGGQSGTCARVPVLVNITAEDYPNNSLFPGENSFTISPCTDNFTAEELATYFTAIAGYEIKVYETEFGTSEATGPLNPTPPNNSYFVGQVSTDGDTSPTPGENNCPSLRVAVGYDPQPTPPPTAASPQTFCDGATVGDLVAQGTSPNTQSIRWYRSATSFQPLPDSTILINGATYYATQVINDRNSPLPPCESETRTAVNVILQPLTNVESTQSFCESVGEGNNFRKPQVQDLSPQGGDFFADENSITPLDPSTELIEGQDYFYRDNGTDCSQDRIFVEFNDTPNAGSTTQTSTCENDPSFNLVDRINDSQLGAPDRDGTFSPALSTGTQIFNPEDYAPGNYTFTYTVGSTSACPDDSSVISIEVQAAPNAGPGGSTDVCSNDIPAFLANPAQFGGLLPAGVTPGGTFSPTFTQLAQQFATNPSAPLTTTYTVSNSNGCTDSSSYSLTVFPSPYAGEDSSATLSTEQGRVELIDFIQGNPDTGGTFSPGNANGDLDPAEYTPGNYIFRYTVNSSNGCSDFSDLTITITDQIICPDVIDDTQEFCESISDADGNNPRRPQIRDLMPMNITWYATATSTDPLSPNQILADEEDYFAGNANGDCPNRESVFVQIGKAPNAGATTNITACRNEDPFDIVSRLNPSILGPAMSGGIVTPALASGTTIFNPALDAARQYTYTIRSEFGKCEDDSTFFNITIIEPIPANAGPDVNLTFCSTDGIQNLFDSLPSGIVGGSFDGLNNGMFDPASAVIGDNVITYTRTSTNACVTGSDSSTFKINVLQGPNAGDDSSVTLSTQQDPVNLFSFINGNPETGGVFAPGNSNGDLNPANYTPGDYTFTYTVTSSNGCTDSSELSVTITDEIICPVIEDTTQEFCESISDSDGNNPRRPQVRDLMPMNIVWYATATSTDALAPTQTLADDEDYFAGNANGNCPNRERVFVQIGKAPNAGATTNITACKTEDPFDIVSRLNPSILGAAQPGGTVSPAFASGTTVFNPAVDAARSYTYTVRSEFGKCDDDFTFVNITITEPIPANAGDDVSLTFCSTSGVQNLFNSLPSGITGGSFDGLVNGMFDPATATIGENTIIFTQTSNDACVTGSDSSTFTITVNEPKDADAGGPVEVSYCVGLDEDINLRTILGDDAITTGSFSSPYEDGLFNPSEAGTGEFKITYTVDGADDCANGTDTATITIMVTDLPDAPTADANQTFCLVDEPTVGDIVVTGSNVVIYTDSDLTDEADLTSSLVSGMTYYATSTSEGETCSSDAIEITVTITDPAAPTLSLDGNEFCRSDNPTVQELINNFTGGVVVYSASTGGTSISSNTPLQNGATYYAASVNGTTGCESSERTAVVAKVEFCGIPEGFSPNGDGINDRFVIPDIAENYPNYTIEFYNRYGNVVYKGNASTPDWDGITNQSGTLGNDVLPVGVYFYILNYNDGQTSPIQGKLYLSR